MDYPFTTDGCSGLFMRAVHLYWRLTGQSELSRKVRALCEDHDATYHPGGSAVERVVADAALVEGVALLKRPVLARFMFLGISVGGSPYLPLPWRWAYGHKYPHGYTKGEAP